MRRRFDNVITIAFAAVDGRQQRKIVERHIWKKKIRLDGKDVQYARLGEDDD